MQGRPGKCRLRQAALDVEHFIMALPDTTHGTQEGSRSSDLISCMKLRVRGNYTPEKKKKELIGKLKQAVASNC